jgi:radical SAM protein with 4Fe4S-binding SPASM domain
MDWEVKTRQVAKKILTPIGLYDKVADIWRVKRYLLYMLQGKRGARSLVANQKSFEARSTSIPMPPVHVSIEPANVCDMGCPVCETGAGIMARPKGYMTFESFKIVIDKVATYTNTLYYYFMGEPFLNKEWFSMLSYAKDRGIPFISTCTNGHFVDADRVVESGIDEINFNIGGITQKTHEIYRVRGDLQRQLDNCRATISEREKRGLKTPRVVLGFIVMKHNENEVDQFLAIAKDMGVDEAIIIDPCVRTVAQARQYMPENEKYWFYNRAAFEQKGMLRPKVLPKNECAWIYHSMVVCWNGDVVPCCRDPQGKFIMGNLLKQDLEEIWNGEKYQAFRERIFTNQGGVSICRLCSSYPVPKLY